MLLLEFLELYGFDLNYDKVGLCVRKEGKYFLKVLSMSRYGPTLELTEALRRRNMRLKTLASLAFCVSKTLENQVRGGAVHSVYDSMLTV